LWKNSKNKFENITLLITPFIQDLNNYITPLRKSVYGETNLNLGKLAEWCLNDVAIPEGTNQAILICYKAIFSVDTLPDDLERPVLVLFNF
jgi:hypothetical protein